MSEDVRTFIADRKAAYAVQPYYVVTQAHEPDGGRASRTVQAGFDIDVYGAVPAGQWQPPEDYSRVCTLAGRLMRELEADTTDNCCIEVIPFASSVIVDTHRQMQREAMLRIRITHGRGLDQPAGPSERRALKAVEARLQDLGVSSRGGAA